MMLRNVQEGLWLSRINQVIDKARNVLEQLNEILTSHYQNELEEGPNPGWSFFGEEEKNKLVCGLRDANKKSLDSLMDVGDWLGLCEEIQLKYPLKDNEDDEDLRRELEALQLLKSDLAYLRASGLEFVDSVTHLYRHFLAQIKEETFVKQQEQEYYSLFHADKIRKNLDTFRQIYVQEYCYLTDSSTILAEENASVKSLSLLNEICDETAEIADRELKKINERQQQTGQYSPQDFLKISQAKEDFLQEKLYQQTLIRLDWIFLAEYNNFKCLEKSEQEKYLLIYSLITEFSDDLVFMEKDLFWQFYFTEKNRLSDSLPNVHKAREAWYKQCYHEMKISEEDVKTKNKSTRSKKETNLDVIENYQDPLNTHLFLSKVLGFLTSSIVSSKDDNPVFSIDAKGLKRSIEEEFVQHINEKINTWYKKRKDYWWDKYAFLIEWQDRFSPQKNKLIGRINLALKLLEENQQNQQQPILYSSKLTKFEKHVLKLIKKINELVDPKPNLLLTNFFRANNDKELPQSSANKNVNCEPVASKENIKHYGFVR